MTEKKWQPQPADLQPASPDSKTPVPSGDWEPELTIQEQIAKNILQLLQKPLTLGDDGLPIMKDYNITSEKIGDEGDADFSYLRDLSGTARYSVVAKSVLPEGAHKAVTYEFDLVKPQAGEVTEKIVGLEESKALRFNTRPITQEDFDEALRLSEAAIEERSKRQASTQSAEGFDAEVRRAEEADEARWANE